MALRASGRGLKTCIVQFMKGRPSGENKACKMLGGLVVTEQYGSSHFSTNPPCPEDIKDARRALDRMAKLMESGGIDILVGDEAITAVSFKLIEENQLLSVMAKKPYGMELVLTGRGATKRLIGAADLVTEMKEIKHYYKKGILARNGIEE